MAKECLKFNVMYTPSDIIGVGFWSHVYSVEQDSNAVMKIVRFETDDVDAEAEAEADGPQEEQSITMFNKEVEIQRNVSDQGLAPSVIDWWVCKDKWGVIVIDRIDMTLQQYLQNNPSEADILVIMKGMVKAINLLHDIGFCHNDIKLENMAISTKKNRLPLKLTTGIKYLYFIDFGLAKRISDPNVYIDEDGSCQEIIEDRRKNRDKEQMYTLLSEIIKSI